MMRHVVLWVTLTLALLGCEAMGLNEAQKRDKESSALLSQIESYRGPNLNKVVSIEQPPVNLTPIRPKTQTQYLSHRVKIRAELPLSMVLSDALNATNIDVWYGDGVDPNVAVSIEHEGTLSGLLNKLERQLKLGFTPDGNTLNVEQYVSRTFELVLPPGLLSDQIGGADQGSGNDEEGSAQIDGQFVTLSSSDVDVFSEVAEGVRGLLALDPDGDKGSDDKTLMGSVRSVPSLSRLVVRTTPARMKEVAEFVEQSKDALTRQIALDIQVLEFRSNLGHNRGINWDLVREIGSGGSLSFFIPGTDLISNGVSPGLAFTGGGKWDGSSALINALNQQGQVSTETPITILVQNHQTNHITQGRTIEFIENLSSDSSEGVVSTETERGKRREGVDFIVVPNIQPSHVYLRTSGMLTKIESLERQKVAGETLTFPQMREAKINFANKLKYGQTIIIASVSQQESKTDGNTFMGIPFLGGTSAVKQRVDTLVLLTPRRADG